METPYPFYRQQTNSDSGITCLKMVAAYYHKLYSTESTRIGMLHASTDLIDLRNRAKQIGFRTLHTRLSFRQLTEESPLPCILPWNKTGFAVFYGKQPSRWRWLTRQEHTASTEYLVVADPSSQLITISKEAFIRAWTGSQADRGGVLLLDPSPEFEATPILYTPNKKSAVVPVPNWLQQASDFFPMNKRLYQYIHNILL